MWPLNSEGLNIPTQPIDQADFYRCDGWWQMKWIISLTGIKGGGGALLMEKVVIHPEMHLVVDGNKLVEKPGALS